MRASTCFCVECIGRRVDRMRHTPRDPILSDPRVVEAREALRGMLNLDTECQCSVCGAKRANAIDALAALEVKP